MLLVGILTAVGVIVVAVFIIAVILVKKHV